MASAKRMAMNAITSNLRMDLGGGASFRIPSKPCLRHSSVTDFSDSRISTITEPARAVLEIASEDNSSYGCQRPKYHESDANPRRVFGHSRPLTPKHEKDSISDHQASDNYVHSEIEVSS